MKNTFENQEEFDNLFSENSRFAILGFPKCGTQALKAHIMGKLNKVCYNLEIAYRKTGINAWSHPDHIGCTPIIIYRDPIERLWSAYHYFQYFRVRKKLSFPEFLEYRDETMQSIGCNDPIECCDYQKYIDKWKKVPGCEKLIILKFEEAKQFMEQKNITKSKPPIPSEYRQLVLQKLSKI